MKVINIFGGPGSRKSTIAAGLFYALKSQRYNVELVDEYAKELTWENNKTQLEDQLFIFASQNRKLWRLRKQVDIVITDSPLPLGLLYTNKNYFTDIFQQTVFTLFNYYDNYNYIISRPKEYDPIGRTQTKEEAYEIDDKLLTLLLENNINFKRISNYEDILKDDLLKEII